MNKKNGGRLVVEALEETGVDLVFGIPGIHTIDIYAALLNSSIRHVTARHEQGAGFMADGYARMTGRPGVALVITGPGLTNILTPMAQAFHDSSPMVVISSQLPLDSLEQGRGYLHELRTSTLVAGAAAKKSLRVTRVEDIPGYIAHAFDLAVSGRPGPVHVEVPLDLLSAVVEMDPRVNQDKATPLFSGEDDLDRAVELLKAARRPVIILGGGARNAGRELLTLAERLAAPVVQTVAGKGIVDERHPHCLGTRLHFPGVREYLKEADVVLAVGTQLGPTDLWFEPLELGGPLIQVDTDPSIFWRNVLTAVGIQADALQAVSALLDRLPESRSSETAEAVVSKLLEKSNGELSVLPGRGPEVPFMLEVLSGLRRGLPEKGVLMADMTGPAYVGLSEFPAYGARTFHHPVGYGTLGWALPAAIGAKLSCPEAPICVLAGDGGFQFSLPELAVACQEELTLPIVLFNDGGFGEIRRTEDAITPGGRIAVDHWNPDFMDLAGSYRIAGRRLRTGDELAEALKEAFGRSKPSIIEIQAGL